MSAVAAALEFLHARKWLVELLLGAALVGGIWIWYNHQMYKQYAAGISAQKAEDDRATAELRKQNAQLTLQNQTLALAAKAKYDTDTQTTLAGAAKPVGVSQLCKPTNTHDSGVGGSKAGGGNTGAAGATSSAPVGGGVPQTNNGFAGDRRALLGAFAALFDHETAILREIKDRQAKKSVLRESEKAGGYVVLHSGVNAAGDLFGGFPDGESLKAALGLDAGDDVGDERVAELSPAGED